MTASGQILRQILNAARWAPSGDNTQPWRFRILDDRTVVVHGFDTREHCVYDLDGHPSQISIGALLETMSIAASAHGWRMEAQRLPDTPETHPTIEVRFADEPGMARDPLLDSIERRSVHRRALSLRPLASPEKTALESAVGPDFRVRWLEGWPTKRRVASVLFGYAKLRLTMPEAYEVHRDIIQWNARYSEDRVPDQALGVDAMTLKVMRHVMASWDRVAFFNRYLAGTWAPRIQMDLVPGIACAAHFVIEASRPARTIDDYLDAGRAVQRFWLTVTHLGLLMQPEMAPLIFERYVREGRSFTRQPSSEQLAQRLAARLRHLLDDTDLAAAVFMGRVGAGTPSAARSVRRPLEDLLVQEPSASRAPAAGSAQHAS